MVGAVGGDVGAGERGRLGVVIVRPRGVAPEPAPGSFWLLLGLVLVRERADPVHVLVVARTGPLRTGRCRLGSGRRRGRYGRFARGRFGLACSLRQLGEFRSTSAPGFRLGRTRHGRSRSGSGCSGRGGRRQRIGWRGLGRLWLARSPRQLGEFPAARFGCGCGRDWLGRGGLLGRRLRHRFRLCRLAGSSG